MPGEQLTVMDEQQALRDMHEVMEKLLALSPYAEFCGLRLVKADEEAGSLSLGMSLRPELERIRGSGQFHGGPIASLIDTAACLAVAMRTSSPPPTISMHVDYLKSAFGPRINATALIRRVGRNLAFVDVDVIDGKNQLVATGSANLALMNNS